MMSAIEPLLPPASSAPAVARCVTPPRLSPPSSGPIPPPIIVVIILVADLTSLRNAYLDGPQISLLLLRRIQSASGQMAR